MDFVVSHFIQEGGYGASKQPGLASEKNVKQTLRALKKIIKKEKFSSVALPKLATGVGRLTWEQVRPLIEIQLGDLDIPIYIYAVYHPDQAAKEPGI